MGWSFAHIDIGKQAHIEQLTSQEAFSPGYTHLEHRLVGNHVWHLLRIEATGRLMISLDLIAKAKHEGWGSKGMSEDSGPCYYDCPLSLLNKASPVTEGYAVEWREKVRAHHAAKTSKPRLVAGQVVKYGPGEYRLVSSAGPRLGWTCESVANGQRYRIKATQLSQSTI